jgi:hypothetical protein
MARYRSKDETDLVWNRIRRQITRDLDTEIQNRREEALNILLSEAWDEYTKRLETGELVQLEAKYASLVTAIVADVVPRGESGALANGS